MEEEREEKFCDKCNENVDAYYRNDGYATPLGFYNAYVLVCPHCGNTDLEEKK